MDTKSNIIKYIPNSTLLSDFYAYLRIIHEVLCIKAHLHKHLCFAPNYVPLQLLWIDSAKTEN